MRFIVVAACIAAAGLAVAAPLKKDIVLFRDPAKYAAFPSLKIGQGDQLWVTFGWNTTRSHYGKAAGGKTGGEALYSPDGGETWRRRGVDKEFKLWPAELASLRLSDGTLVNVGPRMHEVLPKEKKAELEAQGIAVKDWGDHISASYRVTVRRKEPDSEKWESFDAKLPRFASMGLFGNGIVLPDDTILKPVYGEVTLDDDATRAWVLRSANKGKTWSLITMAHDGVHAFNEASILRLPDGRILGMIRTEGGKQTAPPQERGFLWQVYSDDGGLTWSPPKKTDIWGYPPTLLLLSNGDVLCSYGYRRRPYGIRACFSRDDGKTWDTKHEVILRDDALPDGPGAGKGSAGDLGYPRSVELSDGTIFTVYYITLGDGVTHIEATKWSPDYIGPADVPRGADALPKPDPKLPPEHIIGEIGPRRLVYGLMQSFIPTEPQVKMVAVRVSKESAREGLEHTYGLYVAIRKPNAKTWWTKFLGKSRSLLPEQVKVGAWNAFVFDQPVPVTPGQTYVLTVYNLDYIGGGATRLKDGLTGDHSWFINTGPGDVGDYPNGRMAGNVEDDLAFKVYAQEGAMAVPGP